MTMVTYQILADYMDDRGFELDVSYANGTESWRYPRGRRNIVVNYLTDNQNGNCSGYLRLSLLNKHGINCSHIIEHKRGSIGQEGFQIQQIPWQTLKTILDRLPNP